MQPLAREIDSLLDAREAEIEKARTRAADLAHGLKTPLQVLSGEATRLKASGSPQIAGSIHTLASRMRTAISIGISHAPGSRRRASMQPPMSAPWSRAWPA